MGTIEVNSACDMDCPLCFADAGPGYNLTLEEAGDILDHFIKADNNIGYREQARAQLTARERARA